MGDPPTMLLLVLGACVAVVVALAAARRERTQPLVPVIQQRNELRQELLELVGDADEAVLLVREVAAREGRPTFELGVLQKAVARAKQRARQREAAAAAGQGDHA